MKAIVLAAAMTILLLLQVTLAMRMHETAYRVRQMIVLYLLSAAILVGLWLTTPEDLGFIPRSLLVEPRWVDLTATIFFFSAAFFGGVLQLYNLADRGFSLRILVDIMESPSATADVEQMLTGYSGGRGIRWMYEKRICDLLDSGFVIRSGGKIALTRKGKMLAGFFAAIRRFLRVDRAHRWTPRPS